jgi:hypothetical protein
MTDELSPTVAATRFLVPTWEVTGGEHSVRSSQEPAEALRLDGARVVSSTPDIPSREAEVVLDARA